MVHSMVVSFVGWKANQIPKVKVVKLDRSELNTEQSANMPKIPDIWSALSICYPMKQWEDLKTRILPLENPSSKTYTHQTSNSSPTIPLLSAILAMDSVSQVSILRKRISLLEPADTITRNDCMWPFARCAAVDTPLHADTSASIRGLLRKCASIRAMKTELDEEVVMLNILATISGRYFGQSEN
ncbi:hypothetical protein TanjilG_30423 [Lupinus angustifolius]|nr:hypothetical protein TanjilG_30423 [Lupinus angustifolius]